MKTMQRLQNGAALAASAVIAAATTSVFAFTTPADAATGATTAVTPRAVQDCPTGHACLWTEPGWGGARWQGRYNNTPVGSSINNNSLSSANHDTVRVACFWTNNDGTGDVLREGPGSIRQNLGLDPRGSGNWGRVISALTWNC